MCISVQKIQIYLIYFTKLPLITMQSHPDTDRFCGHPHLVEAAADTLLLGNAATGIPGGPVAMRTLRDTPLCLNAHLMQTDAILCGVCQCCMVPGIII